jgi:quercetin dioxygenase-like cupin family protein
MTTQSLKPNVSRADTPPTFFLGLPTVVRATAETTGGAFGLIEHLTMPPGFASPYHTHQREDEAFYVLEGRLAFVCDGEWTTAGPGSYVFGPRGIAHGFTVIGDAPARMLLLCSPGGFEQFVADLSEAAPAPPDMGKLMAVATKYHIDVHGPLPARPAASRS